MGFSMPGLAKDRWLSFIGHINSHTHGIFEVGLEDGTLHLNKTQGPVTTLRKA
jgi:hypothetical protein